MGDENEVDDHPFNQSISNYSQSVTYTLDSTHDGLFTIDAEGILSLGREVRPSEVNKEHKLKITATNNFGSESTEVFK